MSARREHRERLNQKIKYIEKFDMWLLAEPPMFRIFAWRKWWRSRPEFNGF